MNPAEQTVPKFIPPVNLTPKQLANFWSKVKKTETCWLWTGRLSKDGFATLDVFDSCIYCHKHSYSMHIGDIPIGVPVRHKCKNLHCVNPEHLFLGFQKTKQKLFFEKVNKNGTIPLHCPGLGNCWEWIASRDKDGYGIFKFKPENRAHRASWIFHNGKITKSLHVLHRCDNPSCVNPKHLWLGTGKENTEDRNSKNRTRNGIKHHSAKLDAEKVRKIRVLLSGRMSQEKIGRLFGISQNAVWDIKSGETWKHIK